MSSFGAGDLERIKEAGKSPVVRTDVVTASPLERMDALLDHAFLEYCDGQTVPAGRHHLFFLSRTRQSQTKHDGGNPRDAVLPQMPFNQAMWLGTRTEYPGLLRVGEKITKSTTLQNVQLKESGQVPFVLLTVRDEISSASGLAVVEETDLLFRNKPPTPAAPPNGADRPASPKLEMSLVADAPLLFQFSALAYNSHRIHYDQTYSRTVEGFRDPVVHGPLQGALALDLALRANPGFEPRSVSYRMHRPVFMNDVMNVKASAVAENQIVAWIENDSGRASIIVTLIGK